MPKANQDLAGKIEQELGADPWVAFDKWYQQALKLAVPNPNWMMLVSAKDNQPNARVVLLKDYSKSAGFVFYTNYHSTKAKELDSNPRVSLVFYWDFLARQVRINGQVHKTSREQSSAYFATRPKESQIGAWASKQSETLISRQALLDQTAASASKFESEAVPCPPHWGGWQVTPTRFEFWQADPARLHHRLVYNLGQGQWQTSLLYP